MIRHSYSQGECEERITCRLGDFSQELQFAIKTARAAGDAILPLYCRQDIERAIKADRSEVPAADYQSNTIILQALSAYQPDVAVLSEEAVDAFLTSHSEIPPTCWIIDPLNGT